MNRLNRKGFKEIPLPLSCFPDTALEKTLLFLPYDEIARLRRVNKRFNTICKSLLNKGFRAVERYHSKCLKDVKSKLPRRESERRSHPLSRHCDILTAIETRISLLGMTFMKYVDLDLCCFIPGKVIDEIFMVLRVILPDQNPPRAFEILQELRDISSMAMEYFDEKIVQSLKGDSIWSPLKYQGGTGGPSVTSGLGMGIGSLQTTLNYRQGSPSTPAARSFLSPGTSSPDNSGVQTSRDILRLKTQNTKNKKKLDRVEKEMKLQDTFFKAEMKEMKLKITELDKKVNGQEERISRQDVQLLERDQTISEMNRRLVENEQKLLDLSQEKGGMVTISDRVKQKRAAEKTEEKNGDSLKSEGPSIAKRLRRSKKAPTCD